VYSLGELADRLDLAVTGDRRTTISGLASLTSAGPGDLSFLAGASHLPQLRSTRAAAVILSGEYAAHSPVACLLADDPYLAFARISPLFAGAVPPPPGVHASAVVDPAADIHPGASVGALAVVEAGARIGAGAILGERCFLGRGSSLGAATRVAPGAVIHAGVTVGARCVIHSNAVLGGDGFGFARGPQGWERIHSRGGLRIGDDVSVGANTAVDRGTLDDTVIEDGVIIDNLVQIGHNCRVGRGTAIAGCVGLAGSTVVGARCTLAGGVGVVGHVEICDDVHVTGMTMVTRSIREPGSYSSGTPMAPTRRWKRNAARFARLDETQRRLFRLERRRARDSLE